MEAVSTRRVSIVVSCRSESGGLISSVLLKINIVFFFTLVSCETLQERLN